MTNYNEMWSMMEADSFEVEKHLSVYVSCIICNRLLIDAHLGQCGCKYCKGCLDKYINNGILFCPGGTEDCAKCQLSMENNIVRDNGTNRNVSSLRVKCPSDLCDHECELVDMSHHLRVCDKREILCPFREMGCTMESMKNEEISEHLMADIHSHNRLLIEWMTHMRNDMKSLVTHKQEDELINLEQSMKLQISQVTTALQVEMKDLVSNEELTALMREMKTYRDKQDGEVAQLRDAIFQQGKEISLLKEARTKQNKEMQLWRFIKDIEISQLRNSKDRQSKEICQLQSKLDRVPAELFNKVDNGCQQVNGAQLPLPMATMQDNSTDQSNSRQTKPQEPIAIIASFIWNIECLSLFSRSQTLSSDQFMSLDHTFLMHLTCQYVTKKEMTIQFQIDVAPSAQLDLPNNPWPCQCTVTVEIFKRSNPIARQVKSKTCKFDHNARSVPFEFSSDDLAKAGMPIEWIVSHAIMKEMIPNLSPVSIECKIVQ